MKKKIISALLVLVILVNVAPKKQANADVLTLATIAAATYAVAQANGLLFTFTTGTAAGVQAQMESSLSEWIGGSTISQKFGSDQIRIVAGKLAIGQSVYNGIKEFLSDFIREKSVTSTNTQVYSGEVGGVPIGVYVPYSMPADLEVSMQLNDLDNRIYFTVYYNNVQVAENSVGLSTGFELKGGTVWRIEIASGSNYRFRCRYIAENTNHEESEYSHPFVVSKALIGANLTSTAVARTDNYDAGTILSGQEWKGQVNGYSGSDTNLEQLLQAILSGAADNNLDVSGEVVTDTNPTPQPTAIPTRPPVNDTVDGLNDLIQGQDIISGQLEGIGTGVGTISETIEQALDIPTAQEIAENDGAAFKFDLRNLFPFCIPFDIYHLVSIFDVEPVTPHFAFPFNIPAIGLEYSFDIDFTEFDGLAAILRNVELVAFCVGLALATRKVIRW